MAAVTKDVWNQTAFGKWVDEFGVSDLSFILRQRGHSVTAQAIYQWLRGEAQPRPPIALELSRIGENALTLDDIYKHAELVRDEKGGAQ